LRPTPSSYALEHTLPKVAMYVPKRLLTIVGPGRCRDKIVKEIVKITKLASPEMADIRKSDRWRGEGQEPEKSEEKQ